MEFSRQEYWRGLPFSSPGGLPNPGIEPGSPALQADSLPLSHQESPVIPQRGLLAQLSEAVASLFIGRLHFAGVPCTFWLADWSRSWILGVLLLHESFLWEYIQMWGFYHLEILLWLENCHSRRKVLVQGGRARRVEPARLHCALCIFSTPCHPYVSEMSGTLVRTTDPTPPVDSYCQSRSKHCLPQGDQVGLLSLFQMWGP